MHLTGNLSPGWLAASAGIVAAIIIIGIKDDLLVILTKCLSWLAAVEIALLVPRPERCLVSSEMNEAIADIQESGGKGTLIVLSFIAFFIPYQAIKLRKPRTRR